MSEVPFDVTEEVSVGDLSDVKEQRSIMPVAKGVKVRIAKAGPLKSKDGDLMGIKAELRIVDGIELPVLDDIGNPTGETKMAYKNKPLFTGIMDLLYWANPETKNSNWYKTRQHLVNFTAFLKALGFELTNVKVNDGFFGLIKDQEVLVDILHEEESVLIEGERKKTGTFKEKLKNWRKV